MSKQIDVDNFRASLLAIRDYVRSNPDISYEEREKLSELLRVLKYIVQYDILEQCFHDNAFLISVVADIDTRLFAIEEEELLLKQDRKKNVKRLIALKRTTADLKRIKQSILDKDFSFYVKEMNASLQSTEELVTACNAVLVTGKDNYMRLFNSSKDDNVSIEGINVLFNILTMPGLKGKLEEFLSLEHSFAALRKEKADNIRFLEYLKLAKRNEILLREYLAVVGKVNGSNYDYYLVNKETVATGEMALADIATQGLQGILNKRRREQLEKGIEEARACVLEYEKNSQRYRELNNLLHRFGLGPVIDVYSSYGEEKSVEDRVATFIKASFNRKFFSITAAEEKVRARNREIDYSLESEKLYVENSKSKVEEQARDFIVLNHDDVVTILEMLTENNHMDFSPLLAAYILKAISDAKYLSYEEILRVCSINLDVEGLIGMYREQYNVEARDIQQELAQLEISNQAMRVR